jgi:hypothetical protein
MANFDYRNLEICVQSNNEEIRSAVGIDNIEACTSSRDITNTINVSEYGSIRMYPNPTDGTFTIDLDVSSRSGLSYNISDVTGRNIGEKPVSIDSQIQSVDVNHLSAGLYFVTIVSKGKVVTVRKLIKQ